MEEKRWFHRLSSIIPRGLNLLDFPENINPVRSKKLYKYQNGTCTVSINTKQLIVDVCIDSLRVNSHEMDSLWGLVHNSGGHIITCFLRYFELMEFTYSVIWYIA